MAPAETRNAAPVAELAWQPRPRPQGAVAPAPSRGAPLPAASDQKAQRGPLAFDSLLKLKAGLGLCSVRAHTHVGVNLSCAGQPGSSRCLRPTAFTDRQDMHPSLDERSWSCAPVTAESFRRSQRPLATRSAHQQAQSPKGSAAFQGIIDRALRLTPLVWI